MSSNHRSSLVALLALASLVACSRPASSPAELGRISSTPAASAVATFEGRWDPATRSFTITTTPVGEAAAAARLGRVAYQPFSDNTPGTGPDNTFELVTDASPAPGITADGCGPGVDSFDGHITLRSFFTGQPFSSVAIELTEASTGHGACNSGAVTDLSAGLGLWDYGAFGKKGSVSPPDHASHLWSFRYATSEAFTFKGRIMAQIGALPIPGNGATSFEWAPYMFMDPPHAFQHHAGTTLSHVVWNGSAFVDDVGTVAFEKSILDPAPPSTSVGISYPRQAYVGPWPADGAGRYEASPTTLELDTRGEFTACVKFKPGVNPGDLERKVLLAKGNPIGQTNQTYGQGDFGWALTQQHGGPPTGGPQYGFFYRTGNDPSATDAFVTPATDHPEHSAFDYTCGGRANSGCAIQGELGYAGPCIRVMAHGRDVHFDSKVTGSIEDNYDPAALPLVIGSAAGGLWPALDEGVYEVIIDSRAPTYAVMKEIVDAAEGRAVYDGGAYLGNDVDARDVVGADQVHYGFPYGSTAPVSADASGLVDAGTVVKFSQVLATTASAYCVGAEVTSAAWASATGCVLGDVDGWLKVFFVGQSIAGTSGKDQWRALGLDVSGWTSGSRHKFMVCASTTTPDAADLYVDGAAAGQSSVSGPQYDLALGQLLIGTCGFGGGDLTGARIGRVFACPTSNPAACQ